MNPVALEYPDCVLCGESERFSTLFAVRDRRYDNPGRFALVECQSCRLRFLRPRPTREAIAAYYPPDYEAHTETTERSLPWPLALLRSGWEAYQRLFLGASYPTYFFERYRREFGSAGEPPRILDVGCGNGQKLAYVARAGWSTAGVDVSEAAVEHARRREGVRQALVASGESLPFDDGEFDAAMSWHSLEHHHDPLATLRELHRVLKPGGYAVVAVPTGNSRGLELFRAYWGPIEAPRHLYHFTSETLERLGDKAGFTQVKRFYDFTFYGLFVDWELFESTNNVAQAAGLPVRLPHSKPLSIAHRVLALPFNGVLGRLWRGTNLIMHFRKHP